MDVDVDWLSDGDGDERGWNRRQRDGARTTPPERQSDGHHPGRRARPHVVRACQTWTDQCRPEVHRYAGPGDRDRGRSHRGGTAQSALSSCRPADMSTLIVSAIVGTFVRVKLLSLVAFVIAIT